MVSAEVCLSTLIAVAEADDPAVLPIGNLALESFEADCAGSPTSRLKQMRVLGLEFERLSRPTRSAELISDEIAYRMTKLSAA
jgi:hypothetical protein